MRLGSVGLVVLAMTLARGPVKAAESWQDKLPACLACHDTKPAASHALGNTTTLGEACAVCHSPDAQFAIDKVHAR